MVGRTFPHRVLERVARATSFDADLSMLLRAQFIRELRRYPELVYIFKHGLLQEAVLSTLDARAARGALRTGRGVFEELYAGSREEHLDVLASYYARSGNRPKALEYLELAGRARGFTEREYPSGEGLERARGRSPEELQDRESERRIAERIDAPRDRR